jgi:hypothetical protein
MSDKKTAEQVQQENNAHFMERGPGLSYGYGIYVVAKDTPNNKVLLGGLGGMGVGQMWSTMDLERDSQRPGWEEAPEQSSV